MSDNRDQSLRIALACTFGNEYSRMLTRERVAIVDDFDAMLYDERLELWEGAAEYRRRIGKGNLRAYARTFLAQQERENREQTRAERNANTQ